jgi:uncharacterized protein YkwD
MNCQIAARWAVLSVVAVASTNVRAETKVLPVSGSAPGKSLVQETRDQIVDQVNGYRQRMGRGPVEADFLLTNAAQKFAEYMAMTQSFSHTADGTQPSDRAARQGYQGMFVTENIAQQSNNGNLSTSFVNMWINSPGHNANMLRMDVSETGVGVAQGSNGMFYAVQVFSRPVWHKVNVKIVNESSKTAKYKLGRDEFTLEPNMMRRHRVSANSGVALASGETKAKTTTPKGNDQFVIQDAEEEGELVLARFEKPAK